MKKLFETETVKEQFNKEQFTDGEKENFRTSKSLQSRNDKRKMYVIENGVIILIEKRDESKY